MISQGAKPSHSTWRKIHIPRLSHSLLAAEAKELIIGPNATQKNRSAPRKTSSDSNRFFIICGVGCVVKTYLNGESGSLDITQ